MVTENPYAPELSATTEKTMRSRRGLVWELSALIAGSIFGLLFPAVEAALATNGSGPFFPELM